MPGLIIGSMNDRELDVGTKESVYEYYVLGPILSSFTRVMVRMSRRACSAGYSRSRALPASRVTTSQPYHAQEWSVSHGGLHLWKNTQTVVIYK
jgi:hypothetical protein